MHSLQNLSTKFYSDFIKEWPNSNGTALQTSPSISIMWAVLEWKKTSQGPDIITFQIHWWSIHQNFRCSFIYPQQTANLFTFQTADMYFMNGPSAWITWRWSPIQHRQPLWSHTYTTRSRCWNEMNEMRRIMKCIDWSKFMERHSSENTQKSSKWNP